jgi:hypothetical protein
MFMAEQINPVINRKGVGKGFFATNFVQREIRGRLKNYEKRHTFSATMHFEK